jgi:spore coat polysaccharide biosynthesis protein SpsF
MNIRIVTQCRMTSTRLPGKILKLLGNQTVLEHHLRRLTALHLPITIATTTNVEDDVLENLAYQYEVDLVRGSEHNVLRRFVDVADKWNDDWIIRVTSDCPFIDAGLIQRGIQCLSDQSSPDEYVSNCFPRTFARGFDFEICNTKSLREALDRSQDPYDLEHVTPYIWQNKNGKIKLHNIADPIDQSLWRICIDTAEDLELCEVIETQYKASTMNYDEIQNLLRAHPELGAINAHIEQKKS